MSIYKILLLIAIFPATCLGALSPEAEISSKDVKDVDFQNIPSSGAGTLDAIIFASNSSGNTGGSLNLDDSNSGWPKGGGNTTFTGSTWTTSFGELRSFYDTNFVSQGVSKDDISVILFFDVAEKQSDAGILMQEIDIFANVQFPNASDPRNDPANNDITSDQQEDSTPTDTPAGTIDLTYLQQNNDNYLRSLASPQLVGLDANGSGIPDAVAVTGIDPYDSRFADSDTFTIWNKADQFSNAPDTMFLSGDYLMSDLNHGIPLPSALRNVLFLLAVCAIIYLFNYRDKLKTIIVKA